MLKAAFGNNALGRTQTSEWFSRFKRGEISVEDFQRSGRPSTGRAVENLENVRKIVDEDRRNTITDICWQFMSLVWNMQPHSEHLNMRQISGALCFVCAAIFGP
jgi:hypothetical protein